MSNINIIFNGKNRAETERTATYVDLVRMYQRELHVQPLVDMATHPGYVLTITYMKPNGEEGSIVKGGTLELTEGTIINVSNTSAA